MHSLFPHLAPIAVPPREVPDDWEDMVKESHPLAKAGCWAQVVGGVGVLIGAVVVALAGAGLATDRVPALALAASCACASVPLVLLLLASVLRLVVGGKAKANGRAELVTAPVALAGVVQANMVLFDPEEAQFAPAVLAWATSGPLMHDVAGMQDLTHQLARCREVMDDSPAGRVGAALRDEESNFANEPVPAEVAGVPGVLWTVIYIEPAQVGGAIPEHRLLPVLLNPDGTYRDLIPAGAW